MTRFCSLAASVSLSAALLLSPAAAWADDEANAASAAKTVTLAQLQTIVSGFGLTDAGDKKTFASVDDQGPQNLSISMMPIDDGKTLLVSTWLGAIPKDKLAAAPTEKMLEYGDTHRFHFTISADDAKNLFLETRIDPAAVSPQTLRESIDELIATAGETEALWTQDGWKPEAGAPSAAASTKDYKALQDEADTAWQATPLALKTALFTTEKVPGFGDYKPRPAGPFKIAEVLHLYVEPVFFSWKPAPDDKVGIDLSADLLIKTKGGSTVLDAKKAISLATSFSTKVKTVNLTANITLEDSLAATDYVATMIVHDNNGNKTASVDLPFSISRP